MKYCTRFLLATLFSLFSFYSYSADLEVELTSDVEVYENNNYVNYEIIVSNLTGSTVDNISVSSEFISVLSGGGAAFQSTDISGTATLLSHKGDFNNSGDLFVTGASLRQNGKLTYSIRALVADDVIDNIPVQATVTTASETITSNEITVQPVPYEYSLNLSVDKSQYPVTGQLTYTLTAENTGSYKVQHLDINQVFSSLTVESIDGTDVAPFSAVAISASASNSNSDTGSFATSGDLAVSDAAIAVGQTLTYTMEATLVDKLVGDIVVSATSNTKEGDLNSNALTTPPVVGVLAITKHEFENSSPYLVSGEQIIHLSVANTGSGIVHDYRVQHNIANLLSTLGNDLVESNYDHNDVSAHPYQSWSLKVDSIGGKSVSALNDSGEVSDRALDDVVSVYPGETIDYTIAAKITPVTIGVINNLTARVLKSDNSLANSTNTISTPINTEKVLQVGDSEISISKLTTQSQYTPGGEVVYDLTVENSSSKYFANNLIITDKLSCIKTNQANSAGLGSAFKSWKLEVVDGSDNLGTDAGKFSYGTAQTGDLTISPDIAPGKKVVYRLTATVSDGSVGIIVDDASCADDVTESGVGVNMPDESLSVTKDVDSYLYSAGQELTYTITVTNNGDGIADQVSVVDDFASIMVTNIHGNSIPAYSDWEVTATSKHIDGSPTTSTTNSGISGVLTSPDILDVKATLEPKTIITYVVKAHVDPRANGKISNTVVVDGKAIADRGSVPRDFTVSLNKSVKIEGASSAGDTAYYSKPDSTVVYQLVVSNDRSNGFATNVSIKDPISSIQADMLEPDNTLMDVFTSWTITANAKVIDTTGVTATQQALLLASTDKGSYSDNTDLDTVAQIPPNVSITYTITANIDRSNASKIVWGEFTNTASINTPDNGKSANSSAVVYPKDPDVIVTKTTPNEQLEIGKEIVFDINVFNKGAGYANDVDVSDDINALGIFEPGWTITSTVDSHARTGSYADAKSSGWPDGGNIQAKVDIDPKESSGNFSGMGYVTYQIRGIVKSDYPANEVSNTVNIHDPATDTDRSASAEVGDGSVEDFNVSILKVADKVKVEPGKDITYSIILLNNSETVMADNLTVVDFMSEIKSVLANDKDDHFENYPDQSPFEYWQFKMPDDADFGAQTTDDLIYPALGSGDTLTLAPKESKIFQIRARVKDNFIGSDINGSFTHKLANDGYVFRNYTEVTQKSHKSHLENEITPNGANTARNLLVNGKSSQFYSPGDTLTYTIKISSGAAYLNNHKVYEDLVGLDVLLMDGTTAHPFSDVFSVDVTKEDSEGGRGTTDGSADGVIADNKNIDTTIDVAGGDYVLYTVEGVVRDDAVGDITIGGITVKPNDYHLSFVKKVDEANYKPGETLTYHLRITNDGKGNAYNIPVADEISSVTVVLADGSTGPAFDPGWTIRPEVSGGLTGGNAQFGSVTDGADIDTTASIPMGATVDYVVTARVNSGAIGEITNILSVNNDRVSAITKPDAQKFEYKKNIVAYYDLDGTTQLSSGLSGYKPDGYIEYEIELINNNKVHLNDVPIVDNISSIQTTCYNVSTGTTYTCKAFDTWTVSAETDGGSITNAGTVANNSDINTVFDLEAGDDGSTFIRYTIKAHIVENAVGNFKNSALIGGRYQTSSDLASMLPTSISKTHKAYTSTSLSTVKTTYNHQTSAQKVVYHLRIENNGDGLEYGKALQEKFSEIKARLAQTTSSQGDSVRESVYQPKGWRVSATTSGESTTSIGSFTNGNNIDINIPYVSIAPRGWIDFVMESEIRDDSMDSIEVTPFYGGSGFSKATITQDADALNVTKKIKSLGGSSYSSGESYRPGDVVEYELVVKNTQPVWSDNTPIQDLLSNIKVEVIGGAIDEALLNTNITHVVSTGLDGDIDTKPLDYESNGNIDIKASDGLDIAPMEEITFTITGTIREDAVGTVDANSALGGTINVKTEAIPPMAADLVFEKWVTGTTADSSTCSFPSNTGAGCEYNPSGQVVYEIKVTNQGEGTANDVEIKDILSTIKTSGGESAFSSSSVHLLERPDSSRFFITGQYEGSSDLNAVFDLMPGDTVKFELTTSVTNDATGSITNTASVGGVNTNSIVLGMGVATILAEKQTDVTRYIPGQTINYTIYVLNDSDSNSDVVIRDTISNYMVETADGSFKPALESWTIKSRVLRDGEYFAPTSYTNISELETLGDNEDIDATIHMAAKNVDGTETLVEIVITGVIRSDAIGQFTNIANVNGANYRVDAGYILPKQGTVEVTKVTTKTPATYVPGETIGFDVEVKNTGDGYLTKLNVADLVKKIKTDFAAQGRDGQVFDEWTITDLAVNGTDPSLSHVVSNSEVTGADGYEISYNLAPSHSLSLHLEGIVNAKSMGDIVNEVIVTDVDGNKSKAQATYTPDKAELVVTKEVDKAEYEAGDRLTYTIKVTNTTSAWAKDVQITDMMSTIETTTISGTTVSAFNPDSIEISSSSLTGETAIPVVNTADINGTIEIAPNDELTITISGELLPTLHGEVKNVVSVELDGVVQTAEAVSTAAIPTVSITKEVVDEVYVPGEESTYIVTIRNGTNSFADDIQVEDIISALTVDTIDGEAEPAFSYWVLDVQYGDPNTVITRRSTRANFNEDVYANVDLAPLDTVVLTITGTVNQKAVGHINNTATMVFNGETKTAEAELIPAEKDFSFIKTLADGSQEGGYNPGEESEFHISLVNNSTSFAQNIQIKDLISELTVTNVLGQTVPAFTSWDISYEISDDKYSTTTIDPLPVGDDINVSVNLAPSATLEFVVKGVVNPVALGNIVNTATLTDGDTVIESTATLRPGSVVLVVGKIADKAEYTNDDEEIVYTLAVTNRGSVDATNVRLVDEISKLQGANGNPLFTEWTTTIREIVTDNAGIESATVVDTQNSVDLDSLQTIRAYEKNIFEITVVGKIGKGLDDDITNTFLATTEDGVTEEASVTVHVKKYSDNEGELVVTKTALKETAQVGDVIEYEVIIENFNEAEFKGVKLIDRYPSGFQYVEGSAEMTNSGPDGEFDTVDDVITYEDPSVSNTMSFHVGDMLAYGTSGSTIQEKVRIRYLMRVTVGATFGNYVNTAYAMTPAEGMTTGPLEVKSNTSSATVEITPDKLFDTASIIGKVFEDHNGDGYQADATATKIKVIADIPASSYIADSTTLEISDEEEAVRDIIDGVTIKRLFGLSRNRTLPETNKAVLQFATTTADKFDLIVTTSDGTYIRFTKADAIEVKSSGNKKEGLAAENLNVTRNLYQADGHYLWEIVVENMGIYEDGIPGVRLLTVEGIVIETDEYGRYHVPDQWVLDKKGKQFLVKLDTDSLPTGMEVVSENPKVRRITPNALTKFNFSVRSAQKEDSKE